MPLCQHEFRNSPRTYHINLMPQKDVKGECRFAVSQEDKEIYYAARTC